MASTSSSSFTLQALRAPLLHKSHFLGQTHVSPNGSVASPSPIRRSTLKTTAKFNLYEIMGGRGLCNGEQGIQQELQKTVVEETPSAESTSPSPPPLPSPLIAGEDAFEKELLGLTGGFPGGEKGLEKFIQENPPPEKKRSSESAAGFLMAGEKPRPPQLPLLMPGMIAIVKNPNNPYYMYCGIVQRITDGKAGVLFEGGNWDRLISFRLEELERREKGPPMVNPRSAVLEAALPEEK
ncbi:NAD(P)H-quinone oxidoreductase subunit S, chloroplastic [Diospyros lotus]|uniref:NAD(P)H-quinone oxidoreductase subunit S, chloroplastic n=1 Tax=Diospyros lotus TaxID=55363 RepID=UPI00225B35CE|nr:NAD(P)H-quinone oxidoreductase subunit S, chloroplastic [Diospyros lotus]